MDGIAHASKFFYSYLTLAVTLVLLLLVGPYDGELTSLLAQNPREEWVRFFRQSVFQKGQFGYTDLGIFFYAAMIGCYIFAHTTKGGREAFPLLARYSGYLLSSGLLVGIVMVHGIKLALGRARPYQVISGEQPFTSWYQLGPLNSWAGDGSGSFPSGHTATTLWLVALWFIIDRHSRQSSGQATSFGRKINWLSVAVLVVALIQALVTGVTRSMTADHWPTDWLAAVFGGLALISYCFRSLIVYAPEPVPRYWEVKWAGRRIAIGVALACILSGLRLAAEALL